MKLMRVLSGTLVLGTVIGVMISLILPVTASANSCNWTCWAWRCVSTPCPPGNGQVQKCFAPQWDIECSVFNCNCAFDHCTDNCGEIPPPEI